MSRSVRRDGIEKTDKKKNWNPLRVRDTRPRGLITKRRTQFINAPVGIGLRRVRYFDRSALKSQTVSEINSAVWGGLGTGRGNERDEKKIKYKYLRDLLQLLAMDRSGLCPPGKRLRLRRRSEKNKKKKFVSL